MNMIEKRILIVKPSSLGDVVHALPVVHAIKRHYANCHIGWIVQKGFQGILGDDATVDEIIPIDIPSTSDPNAGRNAVYRATVATIRTLRFLRKRFTIRPYHLVLDLHASFRSGLLAITSPGAIRIGFADAREVNTLFQHYCIPVDPGKPHAVDKNLEFARYLKCEPQPEDLRVNVGRVSRQEAESLIRSVGIAPGEKIIFANPAARWATKLWTVTAWARCADLFVRETGARVVFSGSPADVPLIRSITDRMRGEALVTAGRLSLPGVAALIETADVYVGADSGPMHIAAFVGTPVVALFGPTDPMKVGPYGAGHRVIRQERLDCLGCRKRTCSHLRCMEEITPEMVVAATVELKGW